jgi:hypothetical protein
MNQYIVDVIYSDGSVALFGPFDMYPTSKPGSAVENAIEFVTRIKNAPNSCVVEGKIRVLNKV